MHEANPTCSPTRASLITGVYPAWHGCWAMDVKLPEDASTVGDTFASAMRDALHWDLPEEFHRTLCYHSVPG